MSDEREAPHEAGEDTSGDAQLPPDAPAAEAAAPHVASTPATPGAAVDESSPAPRIVSAPPARVGGLPGTLAERPEDVTEVPHSTLAAQSRRDFLLFAAGVAASATAAWWLVPDRHKARFVPGLVRQRLDTLAARIGLSGGRRETVLNRALTFDDDVSEALYSKDRRVRTYDRSEVTRLPNNYHGRTPATEMLATWSLSVAGLASGGSERFSMDDLVRRFTLHGQVTRLVCVEGWSAIAWWGGIRFADFLVAFPPASGAKWASMRSSVSLDGAGRPEPYYVSIDLDTARHPQTLLATHQGGHPLTLAHGAPLRLLAPVKLGLKNIKAVTDIEYLASEPPDYWNERGYSKYDGL